MKKKLGILFLTLIGSSSVSADYTDAFGRYTYECYATSAYTKGYGYSTFSRQQACSIAMNYCVANTPVGYACYF